MISTEYLQRMARYNRWQNESVYRAASSLNDHDRRLDRGSFFKSIHATLSHIIWADHVWMSRISDWALPDMGISRSVELFTDWDVLQRERKFADHRFISWADSASPDVVQGELTWFSGAMQKQMSMPKAVCIMQIFNHQTHHRGQVHAMLTSAGASLDDTDIPFMPDAFL